MASASTAGCSAASSWPASSASSWPGSWPTGAGWPCPTPSGSCSSRPASWSAARPGRCRCWWPAGSPGLRRRRHPGGWPTPPSAAGSPPRSGPEMFAATVHRVGGPRPGRPVGSPCWSSTPSLAVRVPHPAPDRAGGRRHGRPRPAGPRLARGAGRRPPSRSPTAAWPPTTCACARSCCSCSGWAPCSSPPPAACRSPWPVAGDRRAPARRIGLRRPAADGHRPPGPGASRPPSRSAGCSPSASSPPMPTCSLAIADGRGAASWVAGAALSVAPSPGPRHRGPRPDLSTGTGPGGWSGPASGAVVGHRPDARRAARPPVGLGVLAWAIAAFGIGHRVRARSRSPSWRRPSRVRRARQRALQLCDAVGIAARHRRSAGGIIAAGRRAAAGRSTSSVAPAVFVLALVGSRSRRPARRRVPDARGRVAAPRPPDAVARRRCRPSAGLAELVAQVPLEDLARRVAGERLGEGHDLGRAP